MTRALKVSRAERWSLAALLLGAAIACSSSSETSGNGPDGSTEANGGASGSGGEGSAGGAGGFAGSPASGGLTGTGGRYEVCLVCGGAYGAGGVTGSGGAAGGAGSGGAPAFCATPPADWLPPMKPCRSDADCAVVPTYSCCGPGTIYGIAKEAVPEFTQCFLTSPPQGCPPLGCASQARTEDNQPYEPATYLDLSGVAARCVDAGGGQKECTSTLKDSCAHNPTRCSAGDTCSNGCGASCSCQDGYASCPRPSGTCTATSEWCGYPAAPSEQAITVCSCAAPGAPWACTP